jgi:hypothetical protein
MPLRERWPGQRSRSVSAVVVRQVWCICTPQVDERLAGSSRVSRLGWAARPLGPPGGMEALMGGAPPL